MKRVSPLIVGVASLTIGTGVTVSVIRAERQERPQPPASDTAKPSAAPAQRVGPGTPDIPGQSTYKGKWVYENGFIKVPDGRRFKAPAGFEKRADPGGPIAQANKNFDEVAAAAKEMVAEEKKKKERQDLVVNPELIKGIQIIRPDAKNIGQELKQPSK